MYYSSLRLCALSLAATLLGACAGNGDGLNSNGEPAMPGAGPDTPLTADFQSLQDNVFTPICARCHSGASAPEGLQLDAGHSYALLVGVASTEQPGLDRVKPGDPDNSYLVQKIEGVAGIAGARMPFGGPYLPQSTIDTIRQWITDGAPPGNPAQASTGLALLASSPLPHARLTRPPQQLVVGFNREPDFSLVNETTLALEQVSAEGAVALSTPVRFTLAAGNPATVLVQPVAALTAGSYRLHVRGSGPAALADLGGTPLGEDTVIEFTVEPAP